MTRSNALLLVAAMAVLGGCTSGPAKVCAKIDELATKAAAGGDEGAKRLAKTTQGDDTCLTRMQTLHQNDPEEFDRSAACIEGATDLKQVPRCMFDAAGVKERLDAIQTPPPGGAVPSS
ncbi:hypothetical protein [Paraliomyxa miuraensis]|uniref:hypothetical protein n=1 Tax=Paraliomyxa miuraensis TaxID=376150 RepID=UPI002253C751|nr:hypothetical protein [Paraliomyxa miuraensis]MCX4247976.1 hypothetical protein [Paraliomyxa miuraensis]